MIVMKFGGTSVGSAACIKRAAEVVISRELASPIVVLSAMAGVTDMLLAAGEKAIVGSEHELLDRLSAIHSMHDSTIAELNLDEEITKPLNSSLDPIWEEMQKVLTGVLLLRELSPRSRDLLSSFGERLIVPVFTAYLQQRGVGAKAIDARGVIVTKEETDFAVVDFQKTKECCSQLSSIVEGGAIPVVTGFICSTPEGVTKTLGRGGSDYSASIIGSCMNADEIQIWTDVDGVMTADPRIVSSAKVLRQVSYEEAAEMSYFGAKVLHPKTIMPASDLNIPVHIKNTFKPAEQGTLITEDSPRTPQGVKTVTSITGVSLVAIGGRGMLGIPGTAQRAFSAIARKSINVLMFSQGSSEQHISLVVSRQDEESTARALKEEFLPEIEKREVDRISNISDIAIIALVGEGMKSIPGIAARTFGVLGGTSVNILMIAQGSSEFNLSFVVEEKDADAAVQLIHKAFELDSL